MTYHWSSGCLLLTGLLLCQGCGNSPGEERAMANARQDSVAFFIQEGTSALQKGRRAAAIDAFGQVLRFAPDDSQAHYNLGVIFAQQNRDVEALREFERAVAADPDLAAAWANLAFLLVGSDKERALVAARKGVDLAPSSAYCHFALGYTLDLRRQLDEAEQAYTRALEIDSSLVHARFQLGRLHVRRGRTREALETFGQVLRMAPYYRKAHYHIAMIHLKNGETEKGEKALERFKKLSQHALDEQYYAELLYDQKEEQTIEKRVAIHYNLALTLVRQDRFEEALGEFQAAADLDSTYAPALQNIAVIYSRQGRYRQAIQNYRQAIRHRSDYAPTYTNLGSAHFMLGELEQAALAYQNALHLDPNDGAARRELNRVRALQKTQPPHSNP